MALNILFVPYNTEQIKQAYISKFNHKCNNQVTLLMITNGEHSDGVKKWHCLAVKNSSALLRGITSNHNRDFFV